MCHPLEINLFHIIWVQHHSAYFILSYNKDLSTTGRVSWVSWLLNSVTLCKWSVVTFMSMAGERSTTMESRLPTSPKAITTGIARPCPKISMWSICARFDILGEVKSNDLQHYQSYCWGWCVCGGILASWKLNTLGPLCLWQCFKGLVTCIVTLPWIAVLSLSFSINLVSGFCISQSHIDQLLSAQALFNTNSQVINRSKVRNCPSFIQSVIS